MTRLLLVPLWRTRSRERAERSRLVWGERPGGVYVLTPLGLWNSARRRRGLPPTSVRARR